MNNISDENKTARQHDEKSAHGNSIRHILNYEHYLRSFSVHHSSSSTAYTMSASRLYGQTYILNRRINRFRRDDKRYNKPTPCAFRHEDTGIMLCNTETI